VSGSTGHADPLAVSYQGVCTLTGGNGGCDGVIEQAALPQKRRVSSLGDIRDQSVQQGAQPPDDLVLPGAGYTNRTAPWRSVTIPVDKCFAAA
jgi:hypothetical protein